MQNYIWVMIVKFVGVGVLTFSLYGVFLHATIDRLFLMTFIVAGVTLVGDLFILPKMNQALAVVGDVIAYFILYYVLGALVVEATISPLLPALTAAYFGGLAEMVYHIYVMDRIHEVPRPAPAPTRFQTEMAEELHPEAEMRRRKGRKELTEDDKE